MQGVSLVTTGKQEKQRQKVVSELMDVLGCPA